MRAERNDLKELIAERRRTLLWYLLGAGLFVASLAAQSRLSGWMHTVPGITFSLLSGLAFVVAMAKLALLMRRMKDADPCALQSFNDERIEQVRLLAWRYGSWVMLFVQALWVGALAFWPRLVPPVAVALVSIGVGCLVGVGSFLLRDGE